MSVCQVYARVWSYLSLGESAQFMQLSVSTGSRSRSCIQKDSLKEPLIDINVAGQRASLLSGEKHHFLKPSDPSL